MVYENGTLKPDVGELAILEQWAIEMDQAIDMIGEEIIVMHKEDRFMPFIPARQ